MNHVFAICERYESGYGHGLKNDGLDETKTQHSNPDHHEAYRIGYANGLSQHKKYINMATRTKSDENF